jgi:hypothetical protein
MADRYWKDLAVKFEELREKDNNLLKAVLDGRDGTQYEWHLEGANDTIQDDFIALAERSANLAECGTSWQDWLVLLSQQMNWFSIAAAEIFYPGELNEPKRGSIFRVCQKSAIYCGARAIKNLNKAKHKPGPKGPRPDVARRRILIAALHERGFRGRKMCSELTKKRQLLPTDELQVEFRSNWLLWYQKSPKSVYRQLADDRKRAPKQS